MFNKKTKTENKSVSTGVTNSVAPKGASNNIVAGTTLEGKVISQSDIRIDGTLNGALECTGRVIIGDSGFVNGEIHCQNAVIEGKFEGDLNVTDLLSVKETADITGDIKTGRLHIQQGAIFNVKCAMGGQVISSFEEETVTA